MSKDIQNIRESQFVLMYGPGALIEGKNGSRLIPDIKRCLGNRRYKKGFLEKNEFDEVRITNIIKKEEEKESKIHLFSIPSNAAQGLSDFEGSYNTSVFPTWQICHNDEYHKGMGSILYDSYESKNHKCPVCKKDSHSTNVRFVLACPQGHLDDVQWHLAVHDNYKCKPEYYIWKPKGSGLSEIFVKCPVCGAERSIYDIYQHVNFICTERKPEEELPDFDTDMNVFFSIPDRKNPWERKDGEKVHFMSIVQRQSTSLRIPRTLTVLKIPKYSEKIVKLIEKYEFNKNSIINRDTPERFLNAVEDNDEDDYIEFKQYIDEHGFEKFKELVIEIFSDFEKALDIEFNTLNTNEAIRENKDLIKGEFKNYELKWLDNEFPLKICPIEKLKTVTTQLSYQRLPSFDNNNLTEKPPYMSSAFEDDDGFWYPAYEGVGEGIFITSDENPITYLGLDVISEDWKKHINKIQLNSKRDEIKQPLFVWWHTLAHALINSLALSCGYNSAALRERVYIKNGKAGILIYNTSPGEDSGMGGLSDTVDSFDIILRNAMNSLISCANDPLCLKQDVNENGVNGAACHNCLLLSETSCEHRNVLLDRHFFVKKLNF